MIVFKEYWNLVLKLLSFSFVVLTLVACSYILLNMDKYALEGNLVYKQIGLFFLIIPCVVMVLSLIPQIKSNKYWLFVKVPLTSGMSALLYKLWQVDINKQDVVLSRPYMVLRRIWNVDERLMFATNLNNQHVVEFRLTPLELEDIVASARSLQEVRIAVDNACALRCNAFEAAKNVVLAAAEALAAPETKQADSFATQHPYLTALLVGGAVVLVAGVACYIIMNRDGGEDAAKDVADRAASRLPERAGNHFKLEPVPLSATTRELADASDLQAGLVNSLADDVAKLQLKVDMDQKAASGGIASLRMEVTKCADVTLKVSEDSAAHLGLVNTRLTEIAGQLAENTESTAELAKQLADNATVARGTVIDLSEQIEQVMKLRNFTLKVYGAVCVITAKLKERFPNDIWE